MRLLSGRPELARFVGSSSPNEEKAESGFDDQTRLGKGSVVEGTVSFDGSARIDGQVDGDITATGTLILGAAAVITARLQAASVIIAGEVRGDITATERITMERSARVLGNLESSALAIEKGARFEGHVRTTPAVSQRLAVNVD
jgi:cytoskeletal protein CcmA (bactofilin family)